MSSRSVNVLPDATPLVAVELVAQPLNVQPSFVLNDIAVTVHSCVAGFPLYSAVVLHVFVPKFRCAKCLSVNVTVYVFASFFHVA